MKKKMIFLFFLLSSLLWLVNAADSSALPCINDRITITGIGLKGDVTIEHICDVDKKRPETFEGFVLENKRWRFFQVKPFRPGIYCVRWKPKGEPEKTSWVVLHDEHQKNGFSLNCHTNNGPWEVVLGPIREQKKSINSYDGSW